MIHPTRIAILAAFLAATGCHIPVRVIQRTHSDYNEGIRAITDEQLLLNIVRLRYDTMPLFLEISSISTQFSTTQTGSAGGTIFENVGPNNTPNILQLNAAHLYSESPVVTWSVPESREFLGRLLAPLGTDQLTVLAQAGWGETVFEVGVKKFNRLRNKDADRDAGVYAPPSFASFLEAMALLRELRHEDLIDLAYGVMSNPAGADIPRDLIDTEAIPPGIAMGVLFMNNPDDPETLKVIRVSKPLFLRFSRQSDHDPRAQRLRSLLNLNPNKYSFGIIDAAESRAEQLRSEAGDVVTVFDPDARFNEIVLNNRSMMEVLRFASRGVMVRDRDLREGIAKTIPCEEEPLLHIRSSPTEPRDAWVKVKYADQWFHIPYDDSTSRRMFTLVEAMFASIVGTVPGAKPLLTLPVARP